MTPTRTPQVFAVLLALFPRAFREVYGDDMRDVFVDQWRHARARAGLAGVPIVATHDSAYDGSRMGGAPGGSPRISSRSIADARKRDG